MSEQNFSIEQAVRFGWDRMKSNLGFFIVYLILLFIVEGFFGFFSSLFSDRLPFLSLIFSIGSWIVSIISAMFVVKIGLELYDKEKIKSYEFLSFSIPLFFKFLLGYVLYTALVLIGLVLLIVPGIYLAIKYQFVQYLIVDKDMDVIEAFKESGKLTDGHKWNLLLFVIVLIVVFMIGLMIFLVGLFAAIPIIIVAVAHVYKQLSGKTPNTVNETGTVPPPTSPSPSPPPMPSADNPFQSPGSMS